MSSVTEYRRALGGLGRLLTTLCLQTERKDSWSYSVFGSCVPLSTRKPRRHVKEERLFNKKRTFTKRGSIVRLVPPFLLSLLNR